MGRLAERCAGPPMIEADGAGFQATAEVRLSGGGTQRWRIRQDSRIWLVE